jgi:hypothetical protein
MGLDEVDFEEFFEWLSFYGDEEVVGVPGRCFDSPLARFLSAKEGMLVGVDDRWYGRALVDARCWRPLPMWARVFEALCENRFGRVLTAYDAVGLLVHVEAVVA